MLLQMTAPWHTEHFKPKELEKQQVQKGLSGLPFSPEAGHKTLT